MKKGMPWASPSFDAWYFLNIFGVPLVILKLELVPLLDLLSPSSLMTLKNLLEGLVHFKSNPLRYYKDKLFKLNLILATVY